MRKRAGDDKGHTGERTAAFRKAFVQCDHLQQIIHHATFLRVCKESQKRVCHDLADAVDLQQFLATQMFDRCPAVPAKLRDQTRVGGADARNAKAVQEALHSRMPCAFCGSQQILKGFLAEALHRGDLVAERLQTKQIGRLADQSVIDQFLQRHFRKPLDVHRITAHEMHQTANLLRQTVRIRAVQRLHAVLVMDRGRMAADRTDCRNRYVVAAGQVLGNLRNDHVRLVDTDGIADAQFQLAHHADVMHRCAADRRTLQLDRIENRHRIDEPGSGRTPFDFC